MEKIDQINKKWIANSEAKLIESFKSDIFDESIYMAGDRPYVTVLGPTQGGKTTLILRLIGLEGNDFKEVYNTIRGDISLGKRATPCPTVYKISEDDDYRVRFASNSDRKSQNKEIRCKQKEAIEHLNQIYLNRNEISSKSIIYISIPRKHIKNISGLEPILIDLPGFDGYEDDPKIISAMYEEWVRKANCVFLVVFAEHMYKLNELSDSRQNEQSDSRQNEFPEVVKLWKSNPDLFKIVLTAYLKNDSEQNFWRENTPDIQVLNERMLELLKSEHKGIANAPSWLENTPDNYTVFVFDYGKYWFDLEEKDKSLTESFTPILDEHFFQLKKSVKASTNEISKLRARCSLSNVLKSQYEKKLLENQHLRETIQKQIKSIQDEIEYYKKEIKSTEKSIQSCENDIQIYRNVLKSYLQPRDLFVYDTDIDERRDQIARNFDSIKVEINKARDHLEKKTSKQKHKQRNIQRLRQLSVMATQGYDVESLLRQTYTQVARIFDYIIPWNKKLDSADELINEKLNNRINVFRAHLDKIVINPAIKEIELIIADLKKQSDNIKISIERLTVKKTELENDKKKNIKSKDEIDEHFKIEQTKAQVFPDILTREYLAHKEKILKQVNNPTKSTNKNIKNKTERDINRICDLLYLCKGALLLNNIVGE